MGRERWGWYTFLWSDIGWGVETTPFGVDYRLIAFTSAEEKPNSQDQEREASDSTNCDPSDGTS